MPSKNMTRTADVEDVKYKSQVCSTWTCYKIENRMLIRILNYQVPLMNLRRGFYSVTTPRTQESLGTFCQGAFIRKCETLSHILSLTFLFLSRYYCVHFLIQLHTSSGCLYFVMPGFELLLFSCSCQCWLILLFRFLSILASIDLSQLLERGNSLIFKP